MQDDETEETSPGVQALDQQENLQTVYGVAERHGRINMLVNEVLMHQRAGGDSAEARRILTRLDDLAKGREGQDSADEIYNEYRQYTHGRPAPAQAAAQPAGSTPRTQAKPAASGTQPARPQVPTSRAAINAKLLASDTDTGDIPRLQEALARLDREGK